MDDKLKKQSRLQFTKKERGDPILQKSIAKSEKMADKVEKVQAKNANGNKFTSKKVKQKEPTFDEATGKSKGGKTKRTGLRFEEVDKPKPPSKLDHSIKKAPQRVLISSIHKKISENEKDNVGLEAAHCTEKAAEFVVRRVQGSYHSHKLKPYRTMEKAEEKSIKADVNYLYKKSLRDNPQSASNPVSKWQQKQAIKKQYMIARNVKGVNSTQKTATTVKNTVRKGADATVKAVSTMIKNPKVLLILLALALIFLLIAAAVSACSVIFQGMVSSVVSTSYPSEDEELITINGNYTELETTLQTRIDNVKTDYPHFDEYRYDLDSIAHDPHELAAYLTAKNTYYNASEVQGELQTILDMQYKITLTEVVEVRYRTETKTGSYMDSEGNYHSYTYTVEVPYNYYILNVKLISRSIDSVARELLDGEQLELYQVYRETKGNKPLIFGGGSTDGTPSSDLSGVVFVDGARAGNQNIVDIALSQVGNVGGQPYWSWYGFDSRVEWCATYVSWVLSQAGYTQPKFAACQNQGIPYFSSKGQWASRGYLDIAPGDIIFFDWQGDGHSDHVGIVIGTDGNRVYTIEGNSGDACKIKDYDINSSVIMGYGLMN